MNFWTKLLSMVGGGLNSALGMLTSTMQSGFKAAIQFHKEGIAFARDAGLSAKQAQAYTDTLIQRTQVLANRYGVSAEAIMQVQRGLSEATGKQLMLNDAQAEGFVQIDKMMGAQARSKFTEEIMNGMGGQIDTVQGAMAKVYATAAKQGLNAKKLTDKVAQNLSMANRLSFKNGIDGITRMAALSEKLGINMQSVETAAGQFMELDQAIENAARMQMLGGNAAINFGNPLDAAYEANYDPEAFAQRMSNSLAGYAQFDASKGYASINGINMDFVRNIAKAMGISTEEASKMAKKQAEVKYKENAFGADIDALAGGDENKRNYILNNSQLNTKTGKLEVQGKEIDKISSEDWDEMMRLGNMSDEEILREQATKLTSIDEHIVGASAKVTASFADGIKEHLPDLGKKIQDLGDYLSGWAKEWGADTGKVIGKAMTWILQNGDAIKTVADGILSGLTKIFNLASEYTKSAIAVFAIWKLFKGNLFGSGGIASSAASAAGRGLSKLSKGSPYALFKQRYANHASRGVTFGQAARSTWRATSRMAKGTAALGAVTGIIQGLGAISEYSRRKEEINNSNMSEAEKAKALNEAQTDRNSEIGGAVGAGVGTVLGTFFFGPLGGMIGGAVGEFTGKFIGKYWTPIVDTVTSFMSKLIDGIKWLAAKSWDGIKWIIDNNPIGLIAKGIGKLVGKDWSITGAISSIFGGGEKHAEGGVVGGNSYTGDKVPILANSGEAVVTPQQFNKLFGMAETILATAPKQNEYTSILNSRSNVTAIIPQQTAIQAKPVGEKEYIYTPKNNETSNVNGNTVTVKDFNININGTLKLDGGTSSRNLDIRELLNDRDFVNALKDVVKTAINNDVNGGRHMNDLAVMGGYPAQTNIYGK